MTDDEKKSHGQPTVESPMDGLEKQLRDMGDRAVIGRVLTEAAWLEGILTRVLQAHMPEKSNNVLESLYENGPLSTFSHKIKIARAFGFIPPALAAEIHKIRAIRNRFAHTDDHLTFKNGEIVKMVAKLDAAQAARPGDAEDAWAGAVIDIADQLIKLWRRRVNG
ncbi:hypothetical protein P9273_03830 [Mesorhizobium sp. WSM4935]|uniref:DUF4145 domain-containing protein n=1 Tax=Mesorhizobium sp. WSM4935 TaxID=3038547 RepID=UPI002414FF9C|nr:DUF4145 domain-containing protein [Mesorhizobium sp. WSM4935]MDG4874228.1 hypothetical protein [Mesorhizobium sp. WSM4935]